MPLRVIYPARFRRDVRRMRRQGANIDRLNAVVTTLAMKQPLAFHHRDHALTGNWRGYRECHIQPDWLLIYRVEDDELQLARTGSHSELF